MMMRSPTCKTLALLITCGPLLCGFGPQRPGTLSPVSLGMGDTAVAAGAGSVALVGNPAGLSNVRQHTLELGFGRDPLKSKSSFYISQTDATSPSGLAAGVSYGYLAGSKVQGKTRSGTDFRAGLALGLGGDAGKLSLGGSIRRLALDYEESGAPTRSVAGWTGDLGISLALAGSIRFGVVWRNLTKVDAVETPGRVAGGAAVVLDKVIFTGEGSWGLEDQGTAWRGGAAVLLGETVQLRGGYSWDQNRGVTAPSQAVHVGLGYRHKTVTIDAGVGVDVDTPSKFLLAISLTMHLPYTMG